MADKYSQEVYLDVNLGFIDEDTRKIKIPNAMAVGSYDTTLFTQLDAALKPNLGGSNVDFVVGDRNGAAFTGILNADRVAVAKTDFDLS